MRRVDDTPLDPKIAASLDAIDATLAGEPVDPRHAEIAELALLLASERPTIASTFATRLDERVAGRLEPDTASGPVRRVRRRPWVWTPAAGIAAALLVAIVIFTSGSGHQRSTERPLPLAGPAVRSGSAAPRAPATAAGAATATPRVARATSNQVVVPFQAGQPGPAALLLQPPANGRKIIQGAQLALNTAPDRIDAVAQEVFDVVGQERGVVNGSTVTAGSPNGYAQFQLSVPSGVLPQAMASLSTLRYAHVSSRTDTTQDVNDEYQADVQRLADARALRTSLLKQLAAATTQAQIQSLTAQIHDAEASISSDEATLRQLNRQIAYSQITLTINGGQEPVPPAGSSGFTVGKAAHDAGRVLEVAAGVALIAAAALLPLTLMATLAWWIAVTVKHHRRQQVLDS